MNKRHPTQKIRYQTTVLDNQMYEWGRNCATLKFDKATTRRCLDAFGQRPIAQRDDFWRGYHAGPREDGYLYLITAR